MLLAIQNMMDTKSISFYGLQVFYKKISCGAINNEIKQNQQLANQIHKGIIRKSKKRRVYSSSKENT